MSTTATFEKELAEAVEKRRTFAIISHPDAGKTTLTEKVLLYSGAIHLAGTVKGRRQQRHATSDWMALEKERGISVTSSVMQFDYAGKHVNLLDTPGHEDFSEDTFRVLVAADAAVMLLDNRKGVEERTRQLFSVCKRRRMPVFTFVNKCDRAGEDPLKLMSDVEAELGIDCHPVTWPVYRDGNFVGVYHRGHAEIHIFERGEHHGARRNTVSVGKPGSAEMRKLLGDEASDALAEQIALLDAAGHPFSRERLLSGDLSPVYFGSALTNFGVEPFLRDFLEHAPAPEPRESSAGPILPTRPAFSAFVFKIQANMDPRHRDRIAFLRVCSGRYEDGMEVKHVRSGKLIRMGAPQQFLARERTAADAAWPGDVLGVLDRGHLRIGDTLTEGDEFTFADIPRFSPESFARVIVRDPLRRKHLDSGLRHLTEEGAAQLFYLPGTSTVGPSPIVGVVGQLQFDVMVHRLEHEYAVRCSLEHLKVRFPRWVIGSEADVERVASGRGCTLLYDARDNPVICFEDQWILRYTVERETRMQFLENEP